MSAAQRLAAERAWARTRLRRQPSRIDLLALTGQRQDVDPERLTREIVMLQRLIKATEPSDRDMPSMLRRLAERHRDLASHYQGKADALDPAIAQAEAMGDLPRMRALESEHRTLARRSVPHGKAAFEILDVLVKRDDAATLPRLDEMLFAYAVSSGKRGDEARMKNTFLRLIREYPTSRLIPLAYVSFGDYYFDRRELEHAAQLYQKIEDGYPDSPAAAYVLYKHAWCDLLASRSGEGDRWADAIDHFARAVEVSLAREDRETADARALRDAARLDLVEAYMHAGRAAKAQAFFEQVGRGHRDREDQVRDMLFALGVAYFDADMGAESIHTFRALQRRHPGDPATCLWQWQIFLASLAHADARLTAEEVAKLNQLARQPTDDAESALPEGTPHCRDLARDASRVSDLGAR